MNKRVWAASVVTAVTLLGEAAGSAQVRTPPLPAHRPSSLSDLVDAVSLNRDGLENVDLSGDVADHSLFLGDSDGVGVAARFQDDPDGPIFIGWQRRRARWTSQFLGDADVEGLRIPSAAPIRLGRVIRFRPVADHLVVETRLGWHHVGRPGRGFAARCVRRRHGIIVDCPPGYSPCYARRRRVRVACTRSTASTSGRAGSRLFTPSVARRRCASRLAIRRRRTNAIRDVNVDPGDGTVTFSVETAIARSAGACSRDLHARGGNAELPGISFIVNDGPGRSPRRGAQPDLVGHMDGIRDDDAAAVWKNRERMICPSELHGLSSVRDLPSSVPTRIS